MTDKDKIIMLTNSLILMRNQYCSDMWHCCMSAWEDALSSLEEMWVVEEWKYDRWWYIDTYFNW